MYFGLYQSPRRHDRFDAQLYEAPYPGPDLLDRIEAFFRRLLRSLFH